VKFTDVSANLPTCNIGTRVLPGFLTNGTSVVIALCTNTVICGDLKIENEVLVRADEFYTTNLVRLCHYDINGLPIEVQSECSALLTCVPPAACRVTGGGRQDDPLVYPHDVRYVTHGGQVGAPVGNEVCAIGTNWLGNPCIHGRWTHVRHVKGGLRGNFHARYYDTLKCACLDTNLVPKADHTGLFYGPGTMNGNVCGNCNIGPLPRPAPANKIVFTGVGDWADPNGRRASRATLFRVDIEDRGEPGNAHAQGANGKPGRVPDHYRIRIWVLTDSELQQLRGTSGPDLYLEDFRDAISACNGTDAPDGAVDGSGNRVSTVNGTAVFGVRAPNIDDGGILEHGNHQIHPSIKSCDPSNPQAPPLPKP